MSNERERILAKEDAQRKLTRLAVGILRCVAISPYEVDELRHRLTDFIEAQNA